ncbi:52 kDa repressor of the inhibitor of the protein kinase-like, partial [Aphis craccivora]
NLRENSDSNFKLICDTCNQILIDQTNRDNTPSQTPEEYYRRTIFNSFLDHTIVHLSDRFIKHKQIITDLEKLIPSRINVNSLDLSKDTIIFYESLLPDSTVFNEEFSTWKLKWLKDNIEKKLQMHNFTCVYGNCRKDLFDLTARRLKTYLRNRAGEDRLIGLALLSIQKEINVDPNEMKSKQ